jgi:hypothetical protein
LLSSFTSSANSAITGAVSASSSALAAMSNNRLAALETARPEENPSEKISQLGLTRIEIDTPGLAFEEAGEIVDMNAGGLDPQQILSGSELRRSSSASTTSLTPRFST